MTTRTLPPTKRPPLPTAMTLAVLATLGAAAQAQTVAPPAAAASAPKADSSSSTVVVTGLRAALESALNAKRDDKGIVDVIKAEDIAKFPDTNLAESLQRIPGVVIDRDAGEGRNITVRGLGLDFTRVRINGIEALATTGGTDSSGGANRSRGFDFNVFAAELFNSITVRKSSSADVDEGSLGATVDLQTSRPLDFPRGFKATASLKGRYNDLSGKTDPRVAFLLSNTNENKTFGQSVQLHRHHLRPGRAGRGALAQHPGQHRRLQRGQQRQQLPPAPAPLRPADARPGPRRPHRRCAMEAH
jgi:iron complex outermembrane receptor protein